MRWLVTKQALKAARCRYTDLMIRVDCSAAFLMRDVDPLAAARAGIQGCSAGNRIVSNRAGGLFASGDELLNMMVQIRQQLIAGDYRALYAVWEVYGDANDENTPPKTQSRKSGEGIVKEFKSMLSCI